MLPIEAVFYSGIVVTTVICLILFFMMVGRFSKKLSCFSPVEFIVLAVITGVASIALAFELAALGNLTVNLL